MQMPLMPKIPTQLQIPLQMLLLLSLLLSNQIFPESQERITQFLPKFLKLLFSVMDK